MITERDLDEAIAECQGQRNPNANTAIKLAAFYTIKNEMYPRTDGYSFAAAETPPITSGMVGNYGNSEFLQAVSGKDAAAVFRVMDELMRDIRHANRRVYDGVLKKIGAA